MSSESQIPNEKLIKSREAAEILGTSVGVLSVWRCRRTGPRFVRRGRFVRYRLADLHDFVRGGIEETSEPVNI